MDIGCLATSRDLSTIHRLPDGCLELRAEQRDIKVYLPQMAFNLLVSSTFVSVLLGMQQSCHQPTNPWGGRVARGVDLGGRGGLLDLRVPPLSQAVGDRAPEPGEPHHHL